MTPPIKTPLQIRIPEGNTGDLHRIYINGKDTNSPLNLEDYGEFIEGLKSRGDTVTAVSVDELDAIMMEL